MSDLGEEQGKNLGKQRQTYREKKGSDLSGTSLFFLLFLRLVFERIRKARIARVHFPSERLLHETARNKADAIKNRLNTKL